jgi:hypothetical protein
MKKLLIAGSAAALLAVASVPASAQFYAGAGPGGVGVEVGPFGVGVGPRYGWRDRYWGDDYGYRAYGAADCRIVRQRVVTPSGRVIIQRQRECY